MSRYGFDLGRSGEIVVEADTLAGAIRTAEASTGGLVSRGRCLDNYTPPGPGEYVDMVAFRAAMRAMSATNDVR